MRRGFLWIVVGLLIISLSACAGKPASSPKVLTIAHNVDPETLNPMMTTMAGAESVILAAVEKLAVFEAKTMDVKPWLLESWEYIDPKTIKLTLKKNVKFSNGEPLNAEAVKFSIQAWMEQPVMAQASQPLKGSTFEILNDTTLVIKTPDIVPTFLTILGRYGYVVPPKYYSEVGADGFAKAPIGSGPYILAKHEPGNQVSFDKNPNYWRGAVPFDKVIFRIIPEELSRASAVQVGEADIAYYLSFTTAKRLEKAEGVTVHSIPSLRKFLVMYNAEMRGGEPLLDKRVRVALNHAVDVDSIIKQVYEGQAVALSGQYALPAELGFNPDLKRFPYDPAKAKQILSEAGYPKGFTLIFAYPTGRYPKDKEIGEILSSYFEAVGVKVVQRPLEWGQFNKERKDQTLGHMFLVGLLFNPDLEDTMSYMAYGKEARGAPMITWPKEWWDLYNKTRTETDRNKRASIYREMLKMDYDSPYGVYLFAPNDFHATGGKISGFMPREDQFLFLYDVAPKK